MDSVRINFLGHEFMLEAVHVDIPVYPAQIVKDFTEGHQYWMNSDRAVAWPMEIDLSRYHHETMLVVSSLSVSKAFKCNTKRPPSKMCENIQRTYLFNIFDEIDIMPFFFIKATANEERFVPLALLPFFVEKKLQAAFTFNLFEWVKNKLFSNVTEATKKVLKHVAHMLFFVFPVMYDDLPVQLQTVAKKVDTYKEEINVARGLKRKFEELEAKYTELEKKSTNLENENEELKTRLKKLEDKIGI